ncbi:MAG: SMC-Scp complex subunit ScpB [Candidatus Omnitrophica bacterium]|nr:SMC-Scp complex subunit ScpB [Candidatus Omnitrophota bacterium]
MDQSQMDHLKGAIEALLFVSEKPVTLDQLKEAAQVAQVADVREALKSLMMDYANANKGIAIIEIANGFQMLSSPAYAAYIREFYKTRHKEKLSRPALETLAIIAYKQPVSRTDVEVIRGVNSDGVVMHLLNKWLIKISGRKEVPGRPYVYGTTTQFLEYFGLKALEDLPKLEEFPALMAQKNEAVPTVNLDSQVPLVQEEKELEAENLRPVEGSITPIPAEEQTQLDEELARARTRLDIEELERQSNIHSQRKQDQDVGESSGQARLMSENKPEETDHGSQQTSPEN